MQATKTLFVVGAGASCEFGLPAGAALRDQIAAAVDFSKENGDSFLRSAISEMEDSAAGFSAASIIANGIGLSPSIDRFLDIYKFHPSVTYVGKLAIARLILVSECNSTLFPRLGEGVFNRGGGLRFDKAESGRLAPRDTWLGKLFSILQEDIRREGPQHLFDGISFISFNYDRCIEHFLYHAVQKLLSLSADDAARVASGVQILHPYGSVGPLRWQSPGRFVDFGDDQLYTSHLRKAAENVQTFTERVSDEALLQELRTEMGTARRIVFLGFGFHNQNMDLLRPETTANAAEVFATTFDQSEPDRGVTRELVLRCLSGSQAGRYPEDSYVSDGSTARDFIAKFGRYLQQRRA